MRALRPRKARSKSREVRGDSREQNSRTLTLASQRHRSTPGLTHHGCRQLEVDVSCRGIQFRLRLGQIVQQVTSQMRPVILATCQNALNTIDVVVRLGSVAVSPLQLPSVAPSPAADLNQLQPTRSDRRCTRRALRGPHGQHHHSRSPARATLLQIAKESRGCESDTA